MTPRKPLPDDPALLDPNEYNILIPSIDMARHLPNGVRFRMVEVVVDPDPAGKHVWKSGGEYRMAGEKKTWFDVFELSDKALSMIRRASGMDSSATLVMASGNTRIYSGTITQRTRDGQKVTVKADYEMNVDARVEEFRAKLEDALESTGAIESKVWDPTANNGNGKYKRVTLTGDDARRHIDRLVRDQSIHLRKFATSIASTRAQAKAMRQFLALRGNYTQQELARPFISYYYEFPIGMVFPPDAEVAAPKEMEAPPESTITLSPAEPVESARPADAPVASTHNTNPAVSRPAAAVEPLFAGKPTIDERMKMLDDLSLKELRELVDDILSEGGNQPIVGVGSMNADGLKSLIQVIGATRPARVATR